MLREYRTKSGSTYVVDHERLLVRRAIRSTESIAERVSDGWRQAATIQGGEVGHPLVFVWGTGTDEHSSEAEQAGEFDNDCTVVRTTRTTSVVTIRQVSVH